MTYASLTQRFLVEELLPITFYLVGRDFKQGQVLVEPGQVPGGMLLIGAGVCDVEWRPAAPRLGLAPREPGSAKRDAGLEQNPFGKFNGRLNKAIRAERAERECKEQQMEAGGFLVQRLTQGDALTVRGMSPGCAQEPSRLRVVAASRSVRAFELRKECLESLPPSVRVASVRPGRFRGRRAALLRL